MSIVITDISDLDNMKFEKKGRGRRKKLRCGHSLGVCPCCGKGLTTLDPMEGNKVTCIWCDHQVEIDQAVLDALPKPTETITEEGEEASSGSIPLITEIKL